MIFNIGVEKVVKIGILLKIGSTGKYHFIVGKIEVAGFLGFLRTLSNDY